MTQPVYVTIFCSLVMTSYTLWLIKRKSVAREDVARDMEQRLAAITKQDQLESRKK